jgi:hypothetical protein
MRRRLLIVGTAWVIIGILPAPLLAQHLTLDDSIPHSAPISGRDHVPSVEAVGASQGRVDPQGLPETMTARPASRRVLVPLYITSAMLQMMDVHSTRRAIAVGHAEGNPFMSGIASNTTAFVAVKAATAASVILLSEKLRKRNRVAAIGLMIAVNAATAAVVAHNYRVAR